ncbi:MAG: hypothetical protein PVJ28_07455 [Acidimicrobiia bacterium]|jgi:hypothetical protein
MPESHDSEVHDFDNTVVAILDHEPEAADAIDRLSEAGYVFEVLRGADGKAHLDPAGEKSAKATVKRLLNAFGDQYRVLDRLEAELDKGSLVVSVDSPPDEADQAVRILQDHGGEYIWKFGSWTFTRIGG